MYSIMAILYSSVVILAYVVAAGTSNENTIVTAAIEGVWLFCVVR